MKREQFNEVKAYVSRQHDGLNAERAGKPSCLSLPLSAHQCLVGPDQEAIEHERLQLVAGLSELFPNGMGGAGEACE